MSAHAWMNEEELPSRHHSQTHGLEMTAELRLLNGSQIDVADCALFIPSMDRLFGKGSTQLMFERLRSKGFSPSIDPALKIEWVTQSDSAGHRVHEFYTDRDLERLNRNPRNTVYMSVTGIRSSQQKKHKFTVRLHLVGQPKEVARTVQTGTLGQPELNLWDLPKCQPKDLSKSGSLSSIPDVYTDDFADIRGASDEAS
jgi:hypothetical protein